MESKFNYREPIFSKETFVDAINVLLLATFITSFCIVVGLFCVVVNFVVWGGVVIDPFTMLLSGIFISSIFFSIYLIEKKIVNIVWW